MLRRLKIKFVAVVMAVATVMLCLVFALVYHFTRVQLERESLSMMRSVAAAPLRPDRPGDRPEWVRLPYFVLQTGPQGELVASGGGYYDLSDQEFLAELAAACARHGGPTGVIEEYGLRFCREDAPGGWKLVFADITSERAALRGLVRACAAIGALCFAAFLGASVLLASWAVKPVDRAWRQQRQFVADASHELKTPLTVIMTNAELLQGPECADEERARFSGNILVMSRQMRGLVEHLLELARADGGYGRAAFGPVDLSALVESALLPFEPLFFERGLALKGEIEPGVWVWGGEEQLRQTADILLDNARKYAEGGGEVEVSLKRTGRRCCRLSVSNPGTALPEAERKEIFKRFYRADKARSRDGGFGLGLAIAQSIVEGHRGRIWAESAHGRNIFYVELPVRERRGPLPG